MPRTLPHAADTDALLRDVVRLFVQAQRTMTACCSDASAKECEALLLVGQFGPLTVQDFARRMGLEKTWASRLLTRLERKKLVGRVEHPDDGRRWLVALSSAGQEERARIQAGLNEHASTLLNCVPAGQRAAVEQALVVLRDALRACVASCGTGRPGAGGAKPRC
ncbi:MAG TPA: MarR family transcriptional regulator [Opitutaceae bacterium]|nr:MarR family transcriptional regulator [Opitutaceae bacterium]